MLRDPRVRHACWRVVPLETPRILRHCPTCGTARPFRCSERFRLNANGRRLDAWLLYRCADCDFTWNRPLHERVDADALGAATIRELQENDRAAAWRHAFDRDALARLGVRLDESVPWRVDRDDPEATTVQLDLPYPLRVRLERLLAAELGASRRELRAWARAAGSGVRDRDLRRPARHGQVLVLPS